MFAKIACPPIKRGQSFEVAYDVDRLRNDLGNGWYRMGPTFFAAAYVSFDGKPAQEFRLTNYDMQGNISVAQPRVQVPDDAKDVRIWFYGSTQGGRFQYDSNYGANYHFAVEP